MAAFHFNIACNRPAMMTSALETLYFTTLDAFARQSNDLAAVSSHWQRMSTHLNEIKERGLMTPAIAQRAFLCATDILSKGRMMLDMENRSAEICHNLGESLRETLSDGTCHPTGSSLRD